MADSGPLRIQFDDFELDEANARLARAGRPVPLPPKALALLCALARQHGQLLGRNALLDSVWGHRHLSESALKTTIGEVRAALEDDPRAPRYIETVSRFGYRFVGRVAPLRATAPAPPAAGPRLPPATAMVGREVALATLRAAWAAARDGRQQLVWIVGEAGVGKTTLIENFSRELDAGVVVHGQCVEHVGTGEPYLPLLEVLRELCRREPQLPASLRAVSPTWLVQMPWLLDEAERATLQRELVGAHQARMLRELRELLERRAALAPLVVALEDLHWSDVDTLRAIEYLVRSVRTLPLLWLGSFRLTQVIAEAHPLRELRQELRLHQLCTEVLLDSFSESEVGSYLRCRLPATQVPETFVKRLHAHTDGLPLFVANVIDTLAAQSAAGTTEWLHAPAGQMLPVPESLAGVIERQMRRLPQEEQALLDAASVCGMEFSAATIAALLERDSHWVAQCCEELARRGLWLRHAGIIELADGGFDSRFAFLHALYQHVCYQRIPASQRVRYHRQVARAIEADRAAGRAPAPAELALHYERGHESVAALRTYAEAARAALGRFAPREAAYLAAQGLALLPRAPEGLQRMELEFELLRPRSTAASLLHGMASPEARAVIERVRLLYEQLPQTPARAVALDGMGWVHYVQGQFAEALQLARRLEEVAQRSGELVLSVFACNLCGVTLVNLGRLREGLGYLERGIAACAALKERVVSAFVIDPEASMRLNTVPALVNLGRIDEARELLAGGIERAERIRQPIALMLAHWVGGMLEARLDNAGRMAPHVARLAEIVDRGMLPQGEGPALWLRGYVEAHSGDPRAGYAHIREGFACHARLGMFAGCPEVLGYGVEALILARDWAGAQRELDEAVSLAQRIGERLTIPAQHLLQARIALGRGDQTAARRAIRASLDEARAQEASGLELKALLALAELPQHSRKDLAELRAVYDRFTQGHDTASYRRARELLANA